jgi:ribosomal protein S12 methylthiotransferase RimO
MDSVFIHIVSLGCAKNRIDTEHMLGILSESNAVIVDAPSDADIIIVNTCGFINEAKQESIDTILRLAKYKQNGAALIVTGCLAQRYAKELADELPEVDAFLGVSGYSRLMEAVQSVLAGKKYVCCDRIDTDIRPRVLTTPGHLAYVRISDGCSNHCSYCAIPLIRGELRSRGMESILSEISDLRGAGVAEAILVAQDTTRYGEDLGQRALPELLGKAAEIMQGGWLRVLYCYPDGVTDELIDTMLKHGNICRYIDLPLQHFSDSVLTRMNRRQSRESTRKLVKKLHGAGFTVRTSLIVGFPGETQADFEIMTDCVKELKFERLGVFRYSAEEGTPAEKLPGPVPDEIKTERYDALMGLQEGISLAICQEQLGRKTRVIVDGPDEETGMTVARSRAQAPQVDGVTYISSKKDLTPGSFHDVLITDAYEYDLLGELI